MMEILEKAVKENGLVAAFAIVGLVMMVSEFLSRKLTSGRVQGSAIAILIGLAMAYVGGKLSGGTNGLADITLFSGIGLMGGNMLRDFAIVATAFEVHPEEARRAGWIGFIALLLGTVLPFIVGVGVASVFGLHGRHKPHDHWRGRGHLHRRSGNGHGPRSEFGCHCFEYRDGRHQGDHRDGRDASDSEIHASQDAGFGNGVWGTGRDGERRERRTCRDGSQARALRRPRCDVSHWHRLPARAIGILSCG